MNDIGKDRDKASRILPSGLEQIRLLAIDIDGVLTDGGVYVLDDGSEFRRFSIRDGLGLKRLIENGIRVAWLSNGNSQTALHRARHLGIDEVHLGVEDKATHLEGICESTGIPLIAVMFIGDDLTDLSAASRVGLFCAPRDAAEQVRNAADYVTEAKGGHGAVRELCDLLLDGASSPVT